MPLNEYQLAFLKNAMVSKTNVIDPDTGAPLDWDALIPSPSSGSTPPLEPVTLDPTYGDHFVDAALDAKWTRIGIQAGTDGLENGTWWRSPGLATVSRRIYTQPLPGTLPSFMRLCWAGLIQSNGDEGCGPCFYNATPVGVGIYERMDGTTSLAPANNSGASTIGDQTSGLAATARGRKHYLEIYRLALDGLTIYLGRFSADGNSWGQWLQLAEAAAPTLMGHGRWHSPSGSHAPFATDLFDGELKALGNNLVRLPTSGTTTFTATDSYSGFSPNSAGDGNDGTDHAFNGTGAGKFWQAAWSVAQTFDLLMLKGRPTDGWGNGYIEFEDGSRVPLSEALLGGRVHIYRLPAPVTSGIIKIVRTDGGGTNPGLTECQAYLLS
jgi:hypothetical protein